MRNFAWRLAITAALACPHLSSLKATEEPANGPASQTAGATASMDGSSGNSPKTTEPPSTPDTSKKTITPNAPGIDEFSHLLGYLTLLTALAGAAVYLIKFGIPLHRNRSKEERKLQVLEMRPLGNRQFLVVVGYEETRMLLGVTTGKIDYLCPLDSSSSADRDFSRMMENAETKSSTP